jgi:hypothetical protein
MFTTSRLLSLSKFGNGLDIYGRDTYWYLKIVA